MTSLRKRHQLPSLSTGGASTLTKTRRRRKTFQIQQNFMKTLLFIAIFLSSPLLLVILVRYSGVPPSNRHLNAPKQQEQVPHFNQLPSELHIRTASISREQQRGIQDHVIFQIRNNTTESLVTTKIPVVVWPYTDYGAGTAELIHFAENGIRNESSFVEMSPSIDNYDSNVVWIGDYGYAFGPNTWCDAFLEKIVEARTAREKLGLTLQWPILIVDWSDTTSTPRCTHIEHLLGTEWVHYYIRNVVTGRRWNSTIEWVDVGNRVTLPSPNYHHVPLFVRTDTVQSLERVLRDDYSGTNLASPIESLERSVDVSHFWPLNGRGVKETRHARLRHKVSEIISTLGNSTRRPSISTFVGLAGSALQWGRRNVKGAYVQAMLRSKIVVVVQRDDWEDHYRLFEALVSGAMVMTDRMLSLPDGLKNGTSLVEFTSARDLEQKLVYYLQHSEERLEIARQGRLVAMSHHRTWHRVEQIVFGRQLSGCATRMRNAEYDGKCPWIVHASEA